MTRRVGAAAGQALKHRWLSGDKQDRQRGRALDASVVQRLQVRHRVCPAHSPAEQSCTGTLALPASAFTLQA